MLLLTLVGLGIAGIIGLFFAIAYGMTHPTGGTFGEAAGIFSVFGLGSFVAYWILVALIGGILALV